MLTVKEVIVVEGRYDKNTVRQAVDAVVFETSGFGIFSQREKIELLRRLGQKNGLIIMTDSDSAGFLIRNHIKGRLNDISIKQAYIPDIYGVERRKNCPSKEKKIGVEGMTTDIIIQALRQCGATFNNEEVSAEKNSEITKADLYRIGLSGGTESSRRRRMLLKKLNLPERLSPNALLDVLNILYTQDEFLMIAREIFLQNDSNQS